MEDLIKIACDSFIQSIKDSYDNSEIKILSIPYFPHAHREYVFNYIENNLAFDEIVGCEHDQVLHQLLKRPDKHHFFEKIFMGKEILGKNIFNFDFNSRDENSNTLLINLVNTYMSQKKNNNKTISWYYIRHLFSSDYKIQAEDEKFSESIYKEIKNDYEKEKKWVQLRALIKTQNLETYNQIIINDGYLNPLCFLSSFKMGRNIGIGFPNLLSTVNLIFTSYKKNGDIMLKAIQVYGLDQQLENEDKKGTFRRLKADFLADKPEQDEDFEKLAVILFPDLEVKNT